VSPRISVVIPAFNEERFLPRLLASLQRARDSYRQGVSAIEVIVADNGSHDATAAIARSAGCVVVRAKPRVIAAVRNAGARAARGELLAFIDADTQVHAQTFNAIDDYFADPRNPVAGAIGGQPERRSLAITAGWMLVGGVTAAAGYGVPSNLAECMPTGVVCCRRKDWRAVGGYPESWNFAEDAVFMLDLMNLGRRDGRPWGWIRGAPALISTRKFDEHGEWHYVTLPARLAAWALLDPPAIRRWANRYWYGRQRGVDAGRSQ
jgi:glycosyltransferase involved in cell wall biosynthesis